MDQHVVPQPADGSAGERGAFRGVRAQAVGPAGLFADRLAYLGRSLSRGTVWGQKMRDVFPCLESDPETEGHRSRRKPMDTASFTLEWWVPLRIFSWSDLADCWRRFTLN